MTADQTVVEPSPSPPIPSDPRAWQDDLLDMLAGLEHSRGLLAGRRVADGAVVLAVIEQMVQDAEGLAGKTEFPDSAEDAQTEAVAKAGAFVTALTGLRPAKAGLMANMRASWSKDKLPAAAVRECLTAGHEALNAYFALFTDRFKSSKAARGWVDAASAFLADLKADIRDLPE
ncbi:MAG: hypothetical protein U0871_23105 [Gemmataceae bacterium]